MASWSATHTVDSVAWALLACFLLLTIAVACLAPFEVDRLNGKDGPDAGS